MYRSGLNGIELKAGSLLFLRAGTFHHYASKCAFSMVWFHLNAEHPRWRHLAERANFHRAARCMNEVRDLMELNFTESQSPLGRKDSVIEALRRLILAYIDRELAQGDSEDVVLIRCRLEKVWQEVSRNLEKDWDVPKLARIAGMSVSHFHAAVTGAYRISPMKIIRNFRIERAQTLLLNTDCTLESIAERTGYDSPFSLSRAFKAATGISPRFYRRREY
jgi:AraC-like DNA-binding protein